MPNFDVRVPHQLERQVAVERLQQYSLEMQEEHADKLAEFVEEWDDDGTATFTIRAMGFTVSGTTVTHAYEVQVSLKLPFAAVPFRGMIEREVSSRLLAALQE